MPIYECNENQFIENLRKVIDTNFKIIVKRSIKIYADTKHNISRIPDCEFNKYSRIMHRSKQRGNVYSVKPFYDEFHNRFYINDFRVHSARYSRMITLSIPYFKVEYSFDIWGETYAYNFDVLFNPAVKIERRNIKPITLKGKNKSKSALLHVLSFKPPRLETLQIELPQSVLIFDVNQKIKS
tara:strand:+ start:378 stop:926 length:549 start_codon:yes stop_codon:yes gene_type:complete